MAVSVCLPTVHTTFSAPSFRRGRLNLRAPTNAFTHFLFSCTPSLLIQKSEVRERTSVPPSHSSVPASEGTIEFVREEGGEECSVLTTTRSEYNEIVILDTPESRLLLLDSTHNIHSICNKGEKWTGFFWDEFVSLPAVIPQGPVAILGLGGGTVAHLLLDSWPHLLLEGWEIDGILVDKAREFLGLADIEKPNKDGGVLHVHVGDALSPDAVVPGGFAGMVVDLFSDGKLLPQLQQVSTWLELRKRLMPDGRIMVNCGGAYLTRFNATIKAQTRAFPGNLNTRKNEISRVTQSGGFMQRVNPQAYRPIHLSSSLLPMCLHYFKIVESLVSRLFLLLQPKSKILQASFECLMKTYGFLTPDFWRQTRFPKSPLQEYTITCQNQLSLPLFWRRLKN